MKHLLARPQRPTLSRWLGGDTLFAFDFDGTLAPLTDRPSQAGLLPDAREALAQLSSLACVAVVSGRARADLVARLPEGVRYVVGNHGNEGLPGVDVHTRASLVGCCKAWLAQLARMGATGAQLPQLAGVFIEDKGVTLSLHYRHCADHEQAASLLNARVASLNPPALAIPGHMVINLLPPGARTKRHALLALMRDSGCGQALYVGDDDTDELAFTGAPRHWLTVRVGWCEASHARYLLRDPSDVTRLMLLAIRRRAAQGREALPCPNLPATLAGIADTPAGCRPEAARAPRNANPSSSGNRQS